VADINVLAITGTVVRDLEISYTKNDYPIGRFKVAVNNRRKTDGEWEEYGNYFEAVIFGPRAEVLANDHVRSNVSKISFRFVNQPRIRSAGETYPASRGPSYLDPQTNHEQHSQSRDS